MKTKTAVLNGKPDAGNLHVRFDEGEVASAKPRRGSLLYNAFRKLVLAIACGLGFTFLVGAADIRVNVASPASGTGVEVEGSVIALTKAGTYRLTGTSSTCGIRCDADLTLVFDDGLSLTAPSGLPAIDLNGHAVSILSNGTDAQTARIAACNAKGNTRGAIEVNAGSTLTVEGGAFMVSGRYKGAAIGSQSQTTAGTILINGGTVVAEMTAGAADSLGAAIGGGYDADGGTVRISGGDVTVKAYKWGAGIGTGNTHKGGGVPRSIGLVEITGGRVTVSGGQDGGAPIGGGHGNTNGTAGAGGGTIRLLGGEIQVNHPGDTNGTTCYPSAVIGGGNYGGAGADVTIDVAASVTISMAKESTPQHGKYVAIGSASDSLSRGTLKFTNANGLAGFLPFLWVSYGDDYLTGGASRPTRKATEDVDGFLIVTHSGNGYQYSFDPAGLLAGMDEFVRLDRPAASDGVTTFNANVLTLTDAAKKYFVTGSTTTTRLAIGAGTTENPLRVTLRNAVVSATAGPALDLGTSVSEVTLAAGSENAFLVTDNHYSGIQVNEPAKLKILGTGSLHAEGHGHGGGIASDIGMSFGTLEIAGGTVLARAPAIGSPAGQTAAAIGSGWGGAGGTIRIVGGDVRAESASWSAGIGQGSCHKKTAQTMGAVEISGANTVVTAFGGVDGGAGIGGGHGAVSATSGGMTGGSIVITDGATVYASAGGRSSGVCGAALGAGNGGATEPNITIDVSATVILNANGAADIGSVNGATHGVLTITKNAAMVASHVFLSGTKANPYSHFEDLGMVLLDATLQNEIAAGTAAISLFGNEATYVSSADGLDIGNPRADSALYTWDAVNKVVGLTAETTVLTPLKVFGATTENRIVAYADGCTVELCGASISGAKSAIEANGHALNVTLASGTKNSLAGADNYPAICVEDDGNGTVGSVTLDGAGALTATGGKTAAGIGSRPRAKAGDVVINGGVISVTTKVGTGGRSGAAIGGGDLASGGTVTINGGTLTATGVDWSPAIGSGSSYQNTLELCPGTVKINGGVVTLFGGKDGGAAIGGGHPKAVNNATNGSKGGVCEIWGGTVLATGGTVSSQETANHGSAVIGGGSAGEGMAVTISTAATVTLTAGAASFPHEIGRGKFTSGEPAVGSLTIYRDPNTPNGTTFLTTTASDVLDGDWAGTPIFATAAGEDFFAGDVLKTPVSSGFSYQFFRGQLDWSGNGGDANWSTAANWTGELKTDEVNARMNFGVSEQAQPVNDIEGVSVRLLTFAPEAPAYELKGEKALTITDGIVAQSTQPQTISLPITASGDLSVKTVGGISLGAVTGAGSLAIGSGAVTVAAGAFAGDLDLGSLGGSYAGVSTFAGGIVTENYEDADEHLVTVAGTNTFGDLVWPYLRGDHVFLTVPAGSKLTATSWSANNALAGFIHGELEITGDISVNAASSLRGDGGIVKICGKINILKNAKPNERKFDFHLTGDAYLRGGMTGQGTMTVYAPTTIHPYDQDLTLGTEISIALSSYGGKDGNLTFNTTGLDGEGHTITVSGRLYRSGGTQANQSVTVEGLGTFCYTRATDDEGLPVDFYLKSGTLETVGSYPNMPLIASAGTTLKLTPNSPAKVASLTLPETGKVKVELATSPDQLECGIIPLLVGASLTAADLAKFEFAGTDAEHAQTVRLVVTDAGDLALRVGKKGLMLFIY